MNSHSWMIASLPANRPTPIERAGLTDVPVEADRREVDHRQRQADRGRRQRRVLVAGVGHREDHVEEDRGQDHLERGTPPTRRSRCRRRRRRSGPGRCRRRRSRRCPCTRTNSARPATIAPTELRADVDRDLAPGHPAAERGADRDGRVEVGAGDPAEGVGAGQDGQPERQPGRDVVAAAARWRCRSRRRRARRCRAPRRRPSGRWWRCRPCSAC